MKKCQKGYVVNPNTGRCVKVGGATWKKCCNNLQVPQQLPVKVPQQVGPNSLLLPPSDPLKVPVLPARHFVPEYLPQQCKLVDGYIITDKKLGSGAFGDTFVVCLKDNCEYVAKVEKLHYDSIEKTFDAEVNINKYINSNQKNPIVPKFLATKKCDENNIKYGIIIMEKLDGTVDELHKKGYKFTKDDINSIENLFLQLKELNIVHNDVHFNNIMYKMINGKPSFRIIDFGLACFYSDYNNYCKGNVINKYGDLHSVFTYFNYYGMIPLKK